MRRMLSVVLIAITCPIVLAYASGVGNAESLERGTVEIAPSASFSHSSFSFDGDKLYSQTILLISNDVGYCFTDLLEGEAGLLVTYLNVSSENGGSSSATGIGLNGGLRINFASAGNAVPFAGLGAGFVSYSGDALDDAKVEVIAPIVRAGVRVLVGPTGSTNFFVEYAHRSNAGGEEDLTDNQFGIGVGISLFPNRQ